VARRLEMADGQLIGLGSWQGAAKTIHSEMSPNVVTVRMDLYLSGLIMYGWVRLANLHESNFRAADDTLAEIGYVPGV